MVRFAEYHDQDISGNKFDFARRILECAAAHREQRQIFPQNQKFSALAPSDIDCMYVVCPRATTIFSGLPRSNIS
jgi:hypothetical protein